MLFCEFNRNLQKIFLQGIQEDLGEGAVSNRVYYSEELQAPFMSSAKEFCTQADFLSDMISHNEKKILDGEFVSAFCFKYICWKELVT